MPWFKVDDKFYSHPKVLGVNLRAIGLWVLAGAWASDHLTDGYVPRTALPALGAKPQDTKPLVDAGLWVVAENGWQFHDWLELQPSRKQTMEERQREREKKARWRAKARKNDETGRFESSDGDNQT